MSAGGSRRGRRDNGLDATDFTPVADVDPRVGEHLLDLLAVEGIAAFLQPTADVNPITRTTTVPPRPSDRLFVDRRHADAARRHVDRLTADDDPAERAMEAAWASIVAGFHLEVDPAERPWPAAEHLDPRPRPGPGTPGQRPQPAADPTAPGPVPDPAPDPLAAAATGEGRTAPADHAGPEPERPPFRLIDASQHSLVEPERRRDEPERPEPSLLDGLDTFGADLPDDDADDRYTPPPPPPLPRISKYAIFATLSVIAGLILFLSPGLLPIASELSMLLGFTGVFAGFVTLIWRLKPGDDPDDIDPDDGAVV